MFVFFLFKNYILELNIIGFRLKTKILWMKARTFQLRDWLMLHHCG